MSLFYIGNMYLFKRNFFSGSQKGCGSLKDSGNIKVYGCERKTTVGSFPLKLLNNEETKTAF